MKKPDIYNVYLFKGIAIMGADFFFYLVLLYLFHLKKRYIKLFLNGIL